MDGHDLQTRTDPDGRTILWSRQCAGYSSPKMDGQSVKTYMCATRQKEEKRRYSIWMEELRFQAEIEKNDHLWEETARITNPDHVHEKGSTSVAECG